MSKSFKDQAGVLAPPPLIYATALTLGWLLQRTLPIRILPYILARGLGVVLMLAGALLGGSAIIEMRNSGTHIDPGKPTTAIVTGGPYAYSRNPIYLALTLMYSGIALVANLFWALLLLPGVLLVMVRGVIMREEQYLQRKFGIEYLDYLAQVRRWL